MWGRTREALQHWSILIIGVVLLAAALGFGTRSMSPSGNASSGATPAAAQNTPRPQSRPPAAPQKASPTPQQAANAPADPQLANQAAKSQPAAAAPAKDTNAATAASSNVSAGSMPAHNMSNMPMQKDAQSNAPPTPTPAPPSTGGPSPTPAPQPASATVASAGSGDPTAGRLVFRKCQACHSLDPGKNILGPSLASVIGRKAGTEPSYNYSAAMKGANITWNPTTLDQYLADPAKVVPGNKMPFPGLKTDHDRADVIAYLASASSGPQAAGASTQTAQQTPAAPPPSQAPQTAPGSDISYIPDARYSLRTGIAEGRMVFIGVGGEIEGKVNPVLTAAEGQVVQLTLINGEGAEHDIVFPIRMRGRRASPAADQAPRLRFAPPRPVTSSTSAACRPSTRRDAGPVRGDPAASGPNGRRGRHFTRADRPAAADRQARSANRSR
jgi:nitrite reductase (NO-forming)